MSAGKNEYLLLIIVFIFEKSALIITLITLHSFDSIIEIREYGWLIRQMCYDLHTVQLFTAEPVNEANEA